MSVVVVLSTSAMIVALMSSRWCAFRFGPVLAWTAVPPPDHRWFGSAAAGCDVS